MVVEGVTFISGEIRKLTEDEFVGICMPVHFQDRTVKKREKMLRDIYKRVLNEQ